MVTECMSIGKTRAIDKLNDKLKKGIAVIGTHISMPDNSITEMMGEIGFDFVWVDWEHTPMDRGQIQNHLIAARAAGIAGFVRIPWNDPVLVKPVLEMGPDGIVFPMIKTAADARNAVTSCLYPPKGIRGYGPKRANRYGMMQNDEYLAQAESSFWRIMQIEHIEAVGNLKEILRVDGVDTIVVGPNDLSGSVGLITQTWHPDVMKLMDEIGEICREAGKPFGVSMGWQPQAVAEWNRRGISWIACGGDTGYLMEAGMNTLRGVQDIIGGV